jgi:hypothetical protein
MNLTADRPLADPEKAARKLLEIANATVAVQDVPLLVVGLGDFRGLTFWRNEFVPRRLESAFYGGKFCYA